MAGIYQEHYAIFCDGSTVQKENYVGIGLILARLVNIYSENANSLIPARHFLIDDVLRIEKIEYRNSAENFHLYEAHETLAIYCAMKVAQSLQLKDYKQCYIFNDCVTTTWRFNLLQYCQKTSKINILPEHMNLFFKKNGELIASLYPEIKQLMTENLNFQQIGRTYQPIELADTLSKINFSLTSTNDTQVLNLLKGQSFIFTPQNLTSVHQRDILKKIQRYNKNHQF